MSELPLRDWQQKALDLYLGTNKQDFLLNATPGSGKTLWALHVARLQMRLGHIQKLMVITPSDNLRTQWANEAARMNIQLTTDYDIQARLAPDYDGIVTTYQTLSARSGDPYKTLRLFASRYQTMGIIDEIHHVGESLQWGQALREACGPCIKRVATTGTPFRSDNNLIPFITYADGVCQPDFSYGYGDALRDRVVRPIYFNTFDGEVSWFDETGYRSTSFDETLNGKDDARRRRHAVNPKGDWLHIALASAHAKLINELRSEQSDAGAIMVTLDQDHARAAAKILESITGKKPALAISDEKDSSETIKRFAESKDEWIVAVKMVSEGVDIKRLRLCLWATNVQTPLYFKQVAGRIVRVTDKPEGVQLAYMYIPRLEPYLTHAEEIKQEVRHVTDDLFAIEQDEWERLRGERNGHSLQSSIFVSSTGQQSDTIFDGAILTTSEVDEIRTLIQQSGYTNDPSDADIALARAVLRTYGAPIGQSVIRPKINHELPPLEQRKKQRKNAIRVGIARLRQACNDALDYPDINYKLNWAQELQTIDEASLEQLDQRVIILEAWEKAYINGTGRTFDIKRFVRERFGQVAS